MQEKRRKEDKAGKAAQELRQIKKLVTQKKGNIGNAEIVLRTNQAIA